MPTSGSVDVDNEVLRLHGIERPEQSTKSLMTAIQCSNCQAICEPGTRYCGVCGMPLTVQEEQTLGQIVKKIERHPVYQSLIEDVKKRASELVAA